MNAELKDALQQGKNALNQDSNDAEHEALYDLVMALDPSFEYDEGRMGLGACILTAANMHTADDCTMHDHERN